MKGDIEFVMKYTNGPWFYKKKKEEKWRYKTRFDLQGQ